MSKAKQEPPRRRKLSHAPHVPEFRTERLDVFKFTVIRESKLGAPRVVYQGWHRKEDIPRPLVTLTLFPNSVAGHYVEWVETTEGYRLCGYALELMAGLERHLGAELSGEGVTKGGTALWKALVAWEDEGRVGKHASGE